VVDEYPLSNDLKRVMPELCATKALYDEVTVVGDIK
jgi:hypothetical protein